MVGVKPLNYKYQREILLQVFCRYGFLGKLGLGRIARKSRIARRKITITKKVVIVKMAMIRIVRIAGGGLSSIKVLKYE